MNFDKLIACFDADWDESKHPRAKNGQFGKKGSGGSTSTSSKEKKSSTMSKSYKALSPSQKADAKSHVASQIKSMSKEKQISVANRVLKAQGKELIVANKDGTYTWTNKGERVTTQKPPRIKSDKLARAIVSNGYAVPGIKTSVSAETAKASASATKPNKEGGITSEQLAAARRLSSKINGGSSSKKSDNDLMTQKFSSVERQELVRKGIANEGHNLIAHSQMRGGNLKPNDVYETVQLLEGSLSNGASNFKEALEDVKNSSKKGPHYAKIAGQIIDEINKGDRGHEVRSKARHQKYLELAHSKLKPKDKDKVIKSLGDAQYYLESRYHEEGKKFSSSLAENASNMLARALRQPDINTVSQAIGLVHMARRDGAKLGNMAAELVKELANL